MLNAGFCLDEGASPSSRDHYEMLILAFHLVLTGMFTLIERVTQGGGATSSQGRPIVRHRGQMACR